MSKITDEMVEVVARGVCARLGHDPDLKVFWYRQYGVDLYQPNWRFHERHARAALEAAAPMIRDASLEEAAIIAGIIGRYSVSSETCDAIAAAIRAMKEAAP